MRRNGPLAAAPVGAGEDAPDFTLQTFDGQTVKLADLRGKVVRGQFLGLVVHSLLAGGARPGEHLAANIGTRAWCSWAWITWTPRPKPAPISTHFNISYPNGADLGTRISQAYRIRGVPETYIIDQNGTLRATFIGPTTQAQIQAKIDPLLGE